MDPLAPTPDGVDPQKWEAACANVRGWCGWHIAPSVTEDMEVDGSRATVLLPSLHVTDVSAVLVDGVDAAGSFSWAKVGTMRPVYPSWLSFPWYWRGASIVATVTHGFDDCPPEILDVLSDLVTVGGIRVAQAATVGPFARTWSSSASSGPAGVLEAYSAVLGRYRIEPSP